MHWLKLIDMEAGSSLWRGAVFRFPAFYPFEPFVDFMLVRHQMNSNNGLTIICASGYHAGEIEVSLPIESAANGNWNAVSTRWLQRNWEKWVYPSCKVEDVFLCYKPDPPTQLPTIDE